MTEREIVIQWLKTDLLGDSFVEEYYESFADDLLSNLRLATDREKA